MQMPSACKGQKRVEDPLALELWVAVSNHGCWALPGAPVGAAKRSEVLTSSQSPVPL